MKRFKNSDPFLIEKLRHKYAKAGNLTLFRELYSNDIEEIPNRNDGVLWDKLNKRTKQDLEKSPIYKNKIEVISKFLYRKHGNLLDIGFGNGILEKKLYKTNIKLFGIDISRKSTSNLNKEIKGVFKTGTVTKIPFKSNYFDFVLLLDVLEHISTNKTFKALKEVNRVLKKEGYLIISIPLNEGLEEMLGRGENPNGHMRDYTPDIIRAELTISGFKIFKETLLYAFKESYLLKSLVLNFLPFEIRKPNLMIVFAKKK